MELSFELRKHSIADPGIGNQRSIKLGNAEIRFGERRFYIADQVNEQRELARHRRKDCGAARFLRIVLKGMAYREPCGYELPALRPAKNRGDPRQPPRPAPPATA